MELGLKDGAQPNHVSVNDRLAVKLHRKAYVESAWRMVGVVELVVVVVDVVVVGLKEVEAEV